MTTAPKSCSNNTPPWFVGHWREWHRGHGCDKDDGKPRSDAATAEITQHAANTDTGFLTDAALGFLRASTTSGNTLLVRALDELAARRQGKKHEANADTDFLTADELGFLRASTTSENTVRALDELAARREAARWNTPVRRGLAHCMQGPPGHRCSCGAAFDDYYGLAEHVRQSIDCPRCGAAPAKLEANDLVSWKCGHWIERNDPTAKIRGDQKEP